MIAHIHHESVEPVRAHRGVQWIDRGATRLLRARAQQHLPHQQQIALEFFDVPIGRLVFFWPTRVAGCDHASCRTDARRHETQLES